MRGSRLITGGLVVAISMAGASGAAWAGGVAGRSAQEGTAGVTGAAASQGLNLYAPAGAGASSVNVQTNIDNSKTIDSSSNINLNETLNGSNIAYGGIGANVYGFQSNALGVIDGVANYNAGITANSGPNYTAVTDALDSATFLQSQQNGN
jgi:hypothetical protein